MYVYVHTHTVEWKEKKDEWMMNGWCENVSSLDSQGNPTFAPSRMTSRLFPSPVYSTCVLVTAVVLFCADICRRLPPTAMPPVERGRTS